MRRHLSAPLFHPLLIALTGFSLFTWSCERKDYQIVDSIGSAPQIVSASLTPSIVNSDTINVGPDRKATDLLSYNLHISARILHPLGQTLISQAQFSFFRTKREPELAQGILKDNGLFPDSIANDSVFTGSLQFTAVRSEIGTFYAEIGSSDSQDYSSNTIRVPFTILRLNQPPVLSNLVAPDTVHPSVQNSFAITVRATDPDGQADLVSVTRTTPSNLILFLNDNGVNGDVIAGDSTYTEMVSLSPPPPPGSYTFTFKAVDRSNASSAVLTKTIAVQP